MKTGEKGLELIKRFEGLKLSAYWCPADKLTIGYGHTGKDVFQGQRITVQQAEDLLKNDLESFEKIANEAIKVPVSQEQFDAFVSILYNVGAGKKGVRDGIVTLKSGNPSSLLRFLNNREYMKAAGQFDAWNKAGGKVLAGLVARREAEEKLFLGLT